METVVPTKRELFLGFLSLGMISFGGALPLARNMVVERRRWLRPEEFVELLGLCQFLPGGNIINLSVVLGMRFQGVGGAFAALLGLIAMLSMVVIALGAIYQHFHDDPHVRHLFAGLAAAAGLLISMAIKVALPLAAAVALVCFAAIAVPRLPLLTTMLVLTPVSVLLLARFGKNGGGQ
ncbi:MAG: chromate transporter [Candidatus Protistobacter heckmanni]|nr:chromate transporter [Candidatus Protistobacter heckmanni]